MRRKKERKRRKQGKGSDAYWQASHAEWTGVTESRHVKQRDYDNMTESCHIRGRDYGSMTHATWQVLCHGGA
jgi:hypothetical protein